MGSRHQNINITRYLTRSATNQTLKFCQLIEYNMRNFFEDHAQNVVTTN